MIDCTTGLEGEYLTAVTGCGNATRVIRTGDAIEVDGDLGLVMARR